MASAGSAVHGLLTATPRPGHVLACFPTAIYIGVPTSQQQTDVIAVLTIDAVRLPLGIVLPQRSGPRPLGDVPLGAPATVGGGAVELPGLSVRVTRWRNTGVAPIRGLTSLPTELLDGVARRLPDLPPELREPAQAFGSALRALADDVATGSPELEAAVAALIGLGPGLTPAGDDVVCGALVALHACGSTQRRVAAMAAIAAMARAITRCAPATNHLSAALLNAAVRGHGLPELGALLQALPVSAAARPAGQGASAIDQALDALLAVGHTSGTALAAGAIIALRSG